MTLSKTQKGIGIAAIVAVLSYFVYDGWRKRSQVFDLDGNTQWGALAQASRYAGKVAIRATNANHGIAAGDTVAVSFSKRYPSQDYTVLEALTVGEESWIVLDYDATDGADVAGSFKLVKKA